MKQLAGLPLMSDNEGKTNRTNQLRRGLTKGSFLEKWRQAAEQYRRCDARVAAAAIIDDIVADIESLERFDQKDRLALGEAAKESRFSAEHLGRLVRRR